MHNRSILVFLSSFLLSSFLIAQQDKIIAGPMLGYVEHMEALIWLEPAPDVTSLAIAYWPTGRDEEIKKAEYRGQLGNDFNPVKMILTKLNPATTYNYKIIADGEEITFPYPLAFTTKTLWEWRMPPPDFSFLFGSCAYINDPPYDRPGDPYGQDTRIFRSMAGQDADLMIWGGDNTYLREVDWYSATGIYYRNQHTRKAEELQELLAAMSHYAIVDDHDFGPNNSDRSFELKDAATEAFKDYWGQRWPIDRKGTYYSFRWADVDFFLLDNRYYRASPYLEDSVEGQPNEAKAYLGEEQLRWLKDGLIFSNASFKIIVSGSQVLNQLNQGEGYNDYPVEFTNLMNFLVREGVRGVVFLSGDRHLTELINYKPDGFYTLYDFTCSPLTARPYRSFSNSVEFENPQRIAETLFTEQNFAKLTIKGERRNRELLIEVFNIDGEPVWQHTINQSDLKPE